jgi:hypothetical protein
MQKNTQEKQQNEASFIGEIYKRYCGMFPDGRSEASHGGTGRYCGPERYMPLFSQSSQALMIWTGRGRPRDQRAGKGDIAGAAFGGVVAGTIGTRVGDWLG